MNVFLTGGTGFIGQNLASELIRQGHTVYCLIRNQKKRELLPKEAHIILGDITDPASYRDRLGGIDVVLHVAAQLGHYTVTEEEYRQVNYVATVNLLDSAIENNVRQFIFISAGFVVGYGKNLDETAPYNASAGYAETKALAEQAVIEKTRGNTQYTIIRPGYIYGPGDDRRVALYKAVRKKHFILTTSGKAELSPAYISDFVGGVLSTMGNEKAYGEVFNLAGNNCTVKEYFETIAAVQDTKLLKINIGYHLSMLCAKILYGISMSLFKKPGILMPSRIDFIGRDHSISSRKIMDRLGYRPKVSLRDGIAASIAWAKEQNLM